MNTPMLSHQLATQHSATCFLNSLLIGWDGYTVTSSFIGKVLRIPLTDHQVIHIPIKKYSSLGCHQYLGSYYLIDHDVLHAINFIEMVDFICDLLVTPSENTLIFKKRIHASLNNMYQSLLVREESIRQLDYSKLTFKETEQALIIGHSCHPTPKSRDEFDQQDMLQYSPEFASSFHLDWIMADPSIIYQKCAASLADKSWMHTLFFDDVEQTEATKKQLAQGMVPMAMHPWQYQVLVKNPVVIEYIRNSQLTYLGKSKKPWSATSSLRTVYRDDAPYMLKFSMSLKLTNSVRVLLPSEVNRGILLHDVLATENGKKFLAEHPQFNIITEPAYYCLQNVAESIVVCRENPFHGDAVNGKVMLAVLTQDNPLGGENLLQTLISNMDSVDSMHDRVKKWFLAYLTIAIKPLLIAYGDYGIVMEAHQQNLILDLKNGFPVAAYFRDCQDHAYSDLGYVMFANDVPDIAKSNGSVVDERIASRFFCYQVILNSTFNLIASLASEQITEQELVHDLKMFLTEIRYHGVRDPFCLNYLLDSPQLLHKSNFLYSLKSVQDNIVISDQLALYMPIRNPLVKNIYQHYFPSIEKTISLRKFSMENDLEIFCKWQHQPRVAKYWELNVSQQELRDYLEQMQKTQYQSAVIIEMNGKPVGYCEIYWAAKDRIALHYACKPYDRGFHLLIGESHFLGIENTTAVFLSIMNFIYLDDKRTTRIVVEPKSDNERFIKYTKLIPSWRYVKEIQLEEKKAALIMSHREKFIMESVQ